MGKNFSLILYKGKTSAIFILSGNTPVEIDLLKMMLSCSSKQGFNFLSSILLVIPTTALSWKLINYFANFIF